MSESKFKTMRHIETVRNYLNEIIKQVVIGNCKPVFPGHPEPENPTLIDYLIPYLEVSDIVVELIKRGEHHDQSKLQSPEVEIFEIYTPKLRDITYGSDEYNQCLKEMKPALDHHYANNRHHPEFHENGMSDMTIFDQIEWICDCKAATLRHDDGDIMESLEINQKRFGYPDDLKQAFINTVNLLNNSDVYHKANES